ncbi:glutathione S-transferase family protein [Novosphingobium sp. G106]|uniref:glutathione S-transferase family protein n=1 Tax=Novosphingobium sp. G106 TaxID=2849500 RepID=UPI001C2CEBF1|nr:glutathione S-transferase family protein [Novosphingobium sp. G106]MBV1691512.1 glutathione S-transferase family protein [Novosphingobium sp. G106]
MSAALELYGAQTGNCLRVAVTLEELGLPYQIRKLDLGGGEHRRAEFLALNPDGRVPVLVDQSAPDDPLVIAQSNAILLHLCDRRPGVLLPVDDVRSRAIVLERFFYFVTDVIAANFSAFYLNRIGASTEAAGQLSARSIDAIVDAERFLAESRYMAGDTFSLADVVAVTIVNASRDKIAFSDHPLLSRWFDESRNRPAVLRGMQAFAG